jgi:MoxR-like ATPase
LKVSGADVETLDQIITTRRRGEAPEPEFTISASELQQLFDAMERIYLPKPVARYISRLVAATHGDARETIEDVRGYVSYGASPRAAIALAEAARAYALLAGRPTVGFEDVKVVAVPVLNHRLVLNYKARFDGLDASALVDKLLAQLDETGLQLPKGVEVVNA